MNLLNPSLTIKDPVTSSLKPSQFQMPIQTLHPIPSSSPSKDPAGFSSLMSSLSSSVFCSFSEFHDASNVVSTNDLEDVRIAPSTHSSWCYCDSAEFSLSKLNLNHKPSFNPQLEKTAQQQTQELLDDDSEQEDSYSYITPRADSPTITGDVDSESDSLPSTPRSTSPSLSTSPSSCNSPASPSKSLRSSLSRSPSRNHPSKPISFADEHGLSLTIVYEIDEEFCQYPIPKSFYFPSCQFM